MECDTKIQAIREKKTDTIIIGDIKIKITCKKRGQDGKNERVSMISTISRMINNRVGHIFCPKCGSSRVRWRSGGYQYDNEKRCANCSHCWEPENFVE